MNIWVPTFKDVSVGTVMYCASKWKDLSVTGMYNTLNCLPSTDSEQDDFLIVLKLVAGTHVKVLNLRSSITYFERINYFLKLHDKGIITIFPRN